MAAGSVDSRLGAAVMSRLGQRRSYNGSDARRRETTRCAADTGHNGSGVCAAERGANWLGERGTVGEIASSSPAVPVPQLPQEILLHGVLRSLW